MPVLIVPVVLWIAVRVFSVHNVPVSVACAARALCVCKCDCGCAKYAPNVSAAAVNV